MAITDETAKREIKNVSSKGKEAEESARGQLARLTVTSTRNSWMKPPVFPLQKSTSVPAAFTPERGIMQSG
jgi:hypothetical protein